MPDFSYNPGISYRGDAYTYQGLDALGQGIGSFLQNQKKHAEEVAANQALDAKNQVLYNHLSQLPPSPITGRPYLTQDDMLKFQTGSLKQRQGIMEAAAANAATDTALFNQQYVNQLHGASAYNQMAAGGLDVAKTGVILHPPPPPKVQGIDIPGAPGLKYVTGGKEPEIKGNLTPNPDAKMEGVPVPGAPGVTAITVPGYDKPVLKGEVESPLSGKPIMVGGKEVGKYGQHGELNYYPPQILLTQHGPIPLDPIFSDDGRLVPNKRTNRLNGEQVDTSQNDHVVDTDPTGAFFFDKHGGPHQMSEATLAKIDESKATPTPTPVPGLVQRGLQAALQAAGIPGTTAAPSPVPTATPTPTPQGKVYTPAEQQALDQQLNPSLAPAPTPTQMADIPRLTNKEDIKKLRPGDPFLDPAGTLRYAPPAK